MRKFLKVSVLIGFGWAGGVGADPLPLTVEVQVNTTTIGNQVLPKTCTGSSGRVVVWQGPGVGEDIFARLYDGSENPIGPEFTINATTTGDQAQPDVACDDDGDFVVVWKGPDSVLPVDRIYARPFAAAGSPTQGEIVVDATASGPKSAPAVAYSNSGEFLVVWQALDSSMDDGIFGRVFNTIGSPLTNETQINVVSTGNQRDPAIAHIPRTPIEAFAVVWEGGVDANVFLRRVCRVNENLVLEGSELTVNSGTTAGVQENPDVAASTISPDPTHQNRIVVVWQGPSGLLGRIWYRLFDIDNVAEAAETVIDDDLVVLAQAEPSVSMPDVTPELEVQFIATWSQTEAGGQLNGDASFIVAARRPRTLLSELWGAPPANPEFEISVVGEATSNSDVALQPNGDFVVAWQSSGQDTSGEGVYGRFFYANWPKVAIFADGFESGTTAAWQ